MTRSPIALACAVALLASFAPQAQAGGKGKAGKQTFVAKGCNECHTVVGAEITLKGDKPAKPGGDLSKVGDTWDAGRIVTFLLPPTKGAKKGHEQPFKGTDEELQVLVDWLLEQKSEDDE